MHLLLTISVTEAQPKWLSERSCVYSLQDTFTIAPAARGNMNTE